MQIKYSRPTGMDGCPSQPLIKIPFDLRRSLLHRAPHLSATGVAAAGLLGVWQLESEPVCRS
jgi:hypothetical protein